MKACKIAEARLTVAAAGLTAALLTGGWAQEQPPATPPAAAQTQPPSQTPAQTPPPQAQPPAPTPPERRPDPTASCDRVVRETHATFTDTDAFDQAVARQLAARPERLTIDVARPFAPATTPDRLHKWLVEVHRSGGIVRRQDIPCGEAAGTRQPIRFGIRSWFARPSREVHGAARGYDVTLWTQQASAAVAQVQFTRRSAR